MHAYSQLVLCPYRLHPAPILAWAGWSLGPRLVTSRDATLKSNTIPYVKSTAKWSICPPWAATWAENLWGLASGWLLLCVNICLANYTLPVEPSKIVLTYTRAVKSCSRCQLIHSRKPDCEKPWPPSIALKFHESLILRISQIFNRLWTYFLTCNTVFTF